MHRFGRWRLFIIITTRTTEWSMSSALRKMAKQKMGSDTHSAGGLLEIKSRDQFEKLVLSAEVPVMIDFWAPWCGPCRMQGPAFATAARELEGQVRFVKINTEANPALASAFNITSIPALVAMSRGEVVDAHVGLTPAAGVVGMARRALDRHNGVGLLSRVKRLFGGTTPTTPPAS
jgi:thioredoxin